MFFADLLTALVLAVVLSGFIWKIARWGRPGRDFSWGTAFLFVLFVWLATWAVGAWLGPMGPTLLGTPIFMFSLVALAFSILVGYTTPPERRLPPRAGAVAVSASGTKMVASAFGTFFGILLVVFVLALLARYLWM